MSTTAAVCTTVCPGRGQHHGRTDRPAHRDRRARGARPLAWVGVLLAALLGPAACYAGALGPYALLTTALLCLITMGLYALLATILKNFFGIDF